MKNSGRVKLMKAAVVEKLGEIIVKEVAKPILSDDSILVKVRACAICGSDLRILNKGDRRVTFPRVIGHEIAGEIEKVGRDIKGFKPKDRVTIAPGFGCGKCEMCKKGLVNVCLNSNPPIGYALDGGFAEYIVPPASIIELGFVNKIPENVSFEEATISELLACCINSQEISNVARNDTVVIIGAGPGGCMHTVLAKIRGAGKVILLQRSEPRLRMARRFNPDVLIDSKKEDIVERVLEETDGIGADVVIVACPSKEMQEISLKFIKPRGRINFFGGLSHSDSLISIDANIVHYKEVYITGASSSLGRHNRESLGLIADGKINTKDFVTHILPLDEIVKGFELMEKHETIKVVMKL